MSGLGSLARGKRVRRDYRGPAQDLTLAQCAAAGCHHPQCRRAAAAVSRHGRPGTTRRLQALAYCGWSVPDLAQRLGVPAHVARQAQSGTLYPLSGWLTGAVEALYDEVWDVPGESLAAAATARRNGWAPPLAWDDDRRGDQWYSGHGIDDPDGRPAPGWRRPPGRPAEDLAADLAELTAMGLSVNQAAKRMHLSGNTLTRVRAAVEAAS